MTDPRSSDADADEHDAWLRQALRHAPDAAAAPPEALREAILAEARSAVQARARPTLPASAGRSPLDAFAAFWSWLARPPVAAGFASIMAATIVGLMWWDRPMDEALPPPASSRVAAPVVAPPAPAPVTSTLAEPPLAPAAPAVAPTGRVAAPLQKTAPAAGGLDEVRKDRAALATGAAQTTRAPGAVAPTAPSPAPFPANQPPAGVGSLERRAVPAEALAKKAEKEAPEALRAAPEPATATEAAKRAEAVPADADTGNSASAATKPASPARQRGATAARETADSLDARAQAAPKAFAASPPPARDAAQSERRAAADATPRPMTPLLGSITNEGEHWTRPSAGGTSAAVDAAVLAWLASVDAAAAARWQALAEQTSRLEGAAAADPRALQLSRDGRLVAIVRVEDGGVFFFESRQSPQAWFAPLAPDAVARLRATLPAIAR